MTIQAAWRGSSFRKWLATAQSAATSIQSRWRGDAARTWFTHIQESAILVQDGWRRYRPFSFKARVDPSSLPGDVLSPGSATSNSRSATTPTAMARVDTSLLPGGVLSPVLGRGQALACEASAYDGASLPASPIPDGTYSGCMHARGVTVAADSSPTDKQQSLVSGACSDACMHPLSAVSPGARIRRQHARCQVRSQ